MSHIDVAGVHVQLSGEVKLLGVVLNKSLTLDSHVKAMNYHIRAFRHIRLALKVDTAKSVARALLGSRLDYANSILFGTSAKNLAKLQLLQNSVARVIMRSDRRSQSLPILKQQATSQIPDLLQDRGANIQVENNLGVDVSIKSDLNVRAEAVSTICRCLTSTDTTCKNCHRKLGFQVCIAHDLERFAARPCSSQSLLTFRHKLKTFYFKLEFNRTE